MRISHLFGAIAIASLTFARPALAFRVIDIQAAHAQGQNGTPIATIAVPRGHSINISFIESGHYIQSIWLDDPSRVVFNTDAPLCGQSAQGSCGSASIVRIRQLETPINFPGNASSHFGRSTVMTIIATDAQNQRYLYQFVLELTPQNTAPYTAVRIVPTATRPLGVVLRQTQDRLTQVQRGLQIAQQQDLLDTGSPEWPKLQQFIQLTSTGERSLEDAISQSGVSRQLIDRLAAMGSQ